MQVGCYNPYQGNILQDNLPRRRDEILCRSFSQQQKKNHNPFRDIRPVEMSAAGCVVCMQISVMPVWMYVAEHPPEARPFQEHNEAFVWSVWISESPDRTTFCQVLYSPRKDCCFSPPRILENVLDIRRFMDNHICVRVKTVSNSLNTSATSIHSATCLSWHCRVITWVVKNHRCTEAECVGIVKKLEVNRHSTYLIDTFGNDLLCSTFPPPVEISNSERHHALKYEMHLAITKNILYV